LWPLAVKNTKEIWRDKKLLIVSLFFPAFLLLLSHLFYEHTQSYFERIPLAVVNPEKTFPKAGRLLSMAILRIRSRKTDQSFFSVIFETKEKALSDLKDGKVSAALIIPKGFTGALDTGKDAHLTLFLNESDKRSGILAAALTAFVEHFGYQVKHAQGKIGHEPISLSLINQGEHELNPELESLANVFIFALIFLIPFAGGQWVSEIERGSFVRFQLAGFSRMSLLGGTFLSIFILAVTQAAFLLATGTLLGIHLELLVFWIWPVVLILAIAAEGLGLFLSSFFEKEKQLNLFSSLLLIPIYILSGALGKEIVGSKWSSLNPWQGGYSIFTHALSSESPEAGVLMKMILSSLLFLVLGLSFFVAKRYRHV